MNGFLIDGLCELLQVRVRVLRAALYRADRRTVEDQLHLVPSGFNRHGVVPDLGDAPVHSADGLYPVAHLHVLHQGGSGLLLPYYVLRGSGPFLLYIFHR